MFALKFLSLAAVLKTTFYLKYVFLYFFLFLLYSQFTFGVCCYVSCHCQWTNTWYTGNLAFGNTKNSTTEIIAISSLVLVRSSMNYPYVIFVLFHWQELTLADRFMVGVYGFIFASFIVTIVMLRLQRENYYYYADTFYSYTEWLVRITVVCLIGGMKLFLYSIFIRWSISNGESRYLITLVFVTMFHSKSYSLTLT